MNQLVILGNVRPKQIFDITWHQRKEINMSILRKSDESIAYVSCT